MKFDLRILRSLRQLAGSTVAYTTNMAAIELMAVWIEKGFDPPRTLPLLLACSGPDAALVYSLGGCAESATQPRSPDDPA